MKRINVSVIEESYTLCYYDVKDDFDLSEIDSMIRGEKLTSTDYDSYYDLMDYEGNLIVKCLDSRWKNGQTDISETE